MKEKRLFKGVLLALILIIVICIVMVIVHLNNNNVRKDVEVSNFNSYTSNSNISHIVLEIEDLETEKVQQGLAYKYKKITDNEKIDSIMKIINNAKLYEPKDFIADFGDAPTAVTINYSNGEKLRVFTGDEYDDNGNKVNLICKYFKEDGSDKQLYKVDEKLGELIEKLFNE